jgi:hypothetical protein
MISLVISRRGAAAGADGAFATVALTASLRAGATAGVLAAGFVVFDLTVLTVFM